MAIVEPVQASSDCARALRLKSPVDLSALGEIRVSTAAEVARALDRARKPQRAWARCGFSERSKVMRRARRILVERRDEFIEVILGETGKTRLEALFMEIFPSCDALAYYAKRASKILAPYKRRMHLLSPLKQLRVVYRPLGVVGIITPWNGPFVLSLNPTVQALMAGNAVLLKPSEVTPQSGALVGRLFTEAGLPEGVLQVLPGDGSTGAALVEAGVDKVSFTGSVATGRKVGEACGRQLIPCTLELGGNDPMIVCADADLERAANGAIFGGFMNAGQYCCSVERVYVVESVADEFIEKIVAKTKALRQGGGQGADVGAIIWPEQLEIIKRQVEDARAKGATVIAGGRRNPDLKGLFYEPTVITDVNQGMAIMREETFGPVLAIARVRDEAEALRLANDTHYGLNSSVWTKDRSKGFTLATRIDAGSVCINDCGLTYGATEAPFGGLKDSGVGQVNGETGLRGYCHAQPIIRDRLGRKTEPVWYPYDEKKEKALEKVIRFLWGTPLGGWLS